MRTWFWRTPWPIAAVLAGVAALGLVGWVALWTLTVPPHPVPAPRGEGSITWIQPGWTLRTACRLNSPVNSLALPPARGTLAIDNLYVGTTRNGGVYRFNVLGTGIATAVIQSAGDMKEFGDCRVSRLAFRDLDGDGAVELIA